MEALEGLFSRIYHQTQVPSQWLVSKTIPIFKNKGEKRDFENYRPIANLCAASKIFENLILKRILEIQESQNVDLTNSAQHGFKRKRSTSSLSLTLQTIFRVSNPQYSRTNGIIVTKFFLNSKNPKGLSQSN